MKFLKTIRFDPSDTHVFEHAAEPDEWAISGGFWFSGSGSREIAGKTKQAFSNGFLSLESFGFSTFTSVAEIEDGEVQCITKNLANKFVSHFGAPSLDVARNAAKDELEYVMDMCADIPINAIFAVQREFDEDGQLHERFRLVEPQGGPLHTKIWEITE